jgi:hypothetical protein
VNKTKALSWGLAIVLGASSLACGEKWNPPSDAKNTSNANKPGYNAEGQPILHLETWVIKDCSPYTVTVNVAGGNGNIPKGEIPVASGKWSHDIVYRPGADLDVALGVFAKKSCRHMDGWCRIDDGPDQSTGRQAIITSVGSKVCQWTTKR